MRKLARGFSFPMGYSQYTSRTIPRLAREVIPGYRAAPGKRATILHAGPPVTWERMCGPLRGAVMGIAVFEGWARDLADATRMAEAIASACRAASSRSSQVVKARVSWPCFPSGPWLWVMAFLVVIYSSLNCLDVFTIFDRGRLTLLTHLAYPAPLSRMRSAL